MGNQGGWFRQLLAKISAGLRRFMEGRYGTDKLGMFLLRTALILMVVDLFLPESVVKLVVWALSYGLMIWAVVRALSRNTYRRYEENRKFLQFFDALKDREHRYYNCPKCRKRVRVPRGKGKIAISCPRCREKFVRKS